MGQPIFMTENRKAAKQMQNKSSSLTWNFEIEAVRVWKTLKKSGGSALWNEGEGFLKLLKINSKKSKLEASLGGGSRPILI